MCPEIAGRSPSEIPGGNLIRPPDICASKEALLISDGPEETSRHASRFRMGHSIPTLHKQSSFFFPSSQHHLHIQIVRVLSLAEKHTWTASGDLGILSP
ncbi:hypothetical protein NPIL_246131 [Nephila pilipes]|uniref:Uncharacterized protein n=1 Tax=Nephila pilipes TaxID=299642 RepID=A0A8X6MCG9_NEPPI|nr:hypothetical protein NPIL_246131 [Nephila pilipes]